MKVLLTAINAKYIHSNPAVYSLKRYADEKLKINIDIAEYTINNLEDDILSDLYRRNPDFIGFSCYIWNINIIKSIIREYKKLRPETIIWLGGPEAGNDAIRLLTELLEVDGIMHGEGEETLSQVIRVYAEADQLQSINGITYRDNGVVTNPPNTPLDLSLLPFPYDEGTDESFFLFKNRILYYESSRGCPFLCSYCLSSIDKTMRYKEICKVHQELAILLRNKVMQVKFVDRTFNCKSSHSLSIWQYIMENDNGVTNFHFEIAADILTEEEIELLGKMRPGLIQLEIGIQSTNVIVLKAVNRKMDIEKAFSAIRRISAERNVHQHLDLIAGLPYEDYESFKKSFNDVYDLSPEQLQLGFLKVLKGTHLESHINEYGIVYKDNPPYEVLYTKWIDYNSILKLKSIEEMIEVYYNSRQFKHVMKYISHWFVNAFEMYEALAEYYERQKLTSMKHNRLMKYKILFEFFMELQKSPNAEEATSNFLEILEYDMYLRENMKNRPSFLLDKFGHKDKIKELAETALKKRRYKDSIHVGYFGILIEKAAESRVIVYKEQYLLFDYGRRDVMDNDATVCYLGLLH